MQQRISSPKLKWWQGILLIVGIVTILMVFQFFAAVVAFMIGGPDSYSIASVAFWIFGGIIALQLIRRYIMSYVYKLEGIGFRIFRVYGTGKLRDALTVVTRSIEAVGTPEEIEGRFPGTHPSVYTRKKVDIEITALAYRVDGRLKVIHIQPDAAMREKLVEWAEENAPGRKKK